MVVASWLLYRAEVAPSLNDEWIFSTQVQVRCDLHFARLRASAGTIDFSGNPVAVVLQLSPGQRLVLAGQSVRLRGTWLLVTAGGNRAWIRADLTQSIRPCAPPAKART